MEAPMQTVTSRDGTTIAYEAGGGGPAVVLVGTTASDHHALDGLAKPLTADFTVYNYDRRGRGDSGDVQPYAPAREVEDLAALLGAVGRPASLVSGSAGCVLALDAASALGEWVAALYLYEPPFIVGPGRPPVPADYVQRVTRLVADGNRDEAVEIFLVEAIGMAAEYLEPMKADATWETMVKYAHTLAYDGRIVQGTQDGVPLPTGRWLVDQPTEVVVGEGSEPFFHAGALALAELLPNTRYRPLPGQDHSAFWVAPEAVASSITRFLHASAR
jgi:pimeloyl-ACP methyl ester carboxylesterase